MYLRLPTPPCFLVFQFPPFIPSSKTGHLSTDGCLNDADDDDDDHDDHDDDHSDDDDDDENDMGGRDADAP